MVKDDKKNIKEKKKEKKGIGFFKKVKYSISNIEKYPEMATEGVGKAISYIARFMVVLALILSLWTLYLTYELIQQGTQYLEENFPDFSYNDGILTIDSEQSIDVENEQLGKIIADTNTESEETINQYRNQLNEYLSGAIILKDRIIIKNMTITEGVSYSYKESFESINLTSFNKQDVIKFVQSGQINALYFSIFLTLFIYSFVMYFINSLWYALIVGGVGYLTILLLKMKMRFVAIFNMAIYALTLSTILNIVYLLTNIIFNFTIEYFGVMYMTVATIYLVAAIFILKSDLMKKQQEVMKIVEAQQIVKKELEQKEKKEKEEKQKKEKDKEGKKENDGDINHDEPEGSNA